MMTLDGAASLRFPCLFSTTADGRPGGSWGWSGPVWDEKRRERERDTVMIGVRCAVDGASAGYPAGGLTFYGILARRHGLMNAES